MSDPSFLDFDAYARAIYSPPPQLVELAQQDPFWRTFGGPDGPDRWGDDGETDRQRAAAIDCGAIGADSYR